MTVRAAPQMAVELVADDGRWAALDIESLANRAAAATVGHIGLDPDVCEIAILACDDARIAALNADFRGRPTPTNVLSWPAQELYPPNPPRPDPDGTVSLGDIALSFDTCEREAAEHGKTMTDHVSHLIVHGVLHLMGYDHERDQDATLMEALEVEILGKLGVGDPYS